MADMAVDQHHIAYFNQVAAEQHVNILQDLLHRVAVSNQLSPESEPLVTGFADVEVVVAITEFGLAKSRWLQTRQSLMATPATGKEAELEAESLLGFVHEMEAARLWAESKVNSPRTIPDDRAISPI